MKQPESSTQASRNRYTEEYTQEALNLTARMGMPKAALPLGLAASHAYSWRGRSHHQ